MTLSTTGEIPKCELNGIDKIDIVNIIEVALKRLNEKYNPQVTFNLFKFPQSSRFRTNTFLHLIR